MVETIGTKLRRARTCAKISLDDAARATKISVARLTDLEADIYSNFPNIAYARGFLTSYGRYLGVDVRPYLDAFEDTSTFGLDDYQYLSEKPIGEYRVSRRPQPRRRRGYRWLWVTAASALVLSAIGLYSWLLLDRVQHLGDLDKLAAHLDKRANPGSAQALADADAENATRADGQAAAEPGGREGFIFIYSSRGRLVPPPPKPPPLLPLPGDGGILREMAQGSSRALSLSKDAEYSRAPAGREDKLNGAAPGNHPGSRYYVHAKGRNSTPNAEGDDAPQAPVRVNNSLE